ncbi:MAG: peptidoglycan DD-metalloendopeptidase family protein [Microgenomates group bacterium]
MAEDSNLGKDLLEFLKSWLNYFRYHFRQLFFLFEKIKSSVANLLYRQRGKLAKPFVHSGMALLFFGGIVFGPILVEENFTNPWEKEISYPQVLSAEENLEMETSTLITIKPRAEIVEYTVKPGDTISSIAEKFNVSIDTIRWENNLTSSTTIKPGQVLRILPVTGVRHKVKPGETIYSIAKKYQVDPQAIVDWPYNSFANDETFALAVGQELIIPDGIKPKETPTTPRPAVYAQVPGAGVGSGQFVWPTSGRISQGYAWYHKAIDIANKDAPDILAADGGKVVIAGWVAPTAYGNRIVIDHGNGYATLYAHLSQIYVSVGQNVAKGQPIGKMGSTGRSTGTHLHFEIRVNGVAQNPLNYLK